MEPMPIATSTKQTRGRTVEVDYLANKVQSFVGAHAVIELLTAVSQA